MKNSNSRSVTVSKMISTEQETVCLSNSCDASILPTFSAVLPNQTLLRGLKDSGSQLNFVQSDFAKANNLEIVKENIDLTIKGINVPKKISSLLML